MERRLNEVEWSRTTTNSGSLSTSQNGPSSGNVSLTNAADHNSDLGNGTSSGPACSDLFPTNVIDTEDGLEDDCDDPLTLIEKDRIIRSLETEVEAQVCK